MRPALRDAVRERFAFQCGYCGVHEDALGARLTIDHFQPVSQGGTNDIENLVYACHACNEFKSDFWPRDTQSPPLHPLRDDLTLHLVESVKNVLVPLTPRGQVYIQMVRLNRPELVERRRRDYRQQLRQELLSELIQQFESLEQEIRQLRSHLSS